MQKTTVSGVEIFENETNKGVEGFSPQFMLRGANNRRFFAREKLTQVMTSLSISMSEINTEEDKALAVAQGLQAEGVIVTLLKVWV